jgi:hypothetical protein
VEFEKCKRKTNMTRLKIFLCVLMIVSLIGCGSGADENETDISTGQVSSQQKNRDQADALAQKKPKRPPNGWIKKISLSKQLGPEGTALKFKVETTKPLQENQYLSYIYWKNQEKLMETPQDTLPPTAYKKGDLLFVDVVLYQEDQVLEKRRSELLQIENSSPVIKEVKIPEIDGPGVYRIIVDAKDPDGDKITFSLAEDSLPEELQIDPHSGTVTYILGENAPPENLKFTITADDGDKGITKKIVTLNFNITRPAENQERRRS